MTEAGNFSPFNFPPVDAGLSNSSLYSIEGHPDRVVRFHISDDLDQGPRFKQLFGEFGDYGIDVPNSSWVWGTRDGKQGLYIITDKIVGLNLDDAIRSEKTKIAPVVDTLMANIARYYTNKYINGGLYLSDIRSDQFIYNADESKAYMVDFGVVADNCITSERSTRLNLLHRVRCLSQDVASAEYEIGHPLEIIRNALGKFVESVDNSDIDYLEIAISL